MPLPRVEIPVPIVWRGLTRDHEDAGKEGRATREYAADVAREGWAGSTVSAQAPKHPGPRPRRKPVRGGYFVRTVLLLKPRTWLAWRGIRIAEPKVRISRSWEDAGATIARGERSVELGNPFPNTVFHAQKKATIRPWALRLAPGGPGGLAGYE